MSTRTVRSRPSHVAPQTLRQAKAAYKKTGFRLSERELRQIERGAEELRRAERLKEQERKKKANQKKREERERKEREAREATGIGLATQLAGFSHTQRRMKSAMENFVAAGKLKAESQMVEIPRPADPAQEGDVDELWDQDLLEELVLLSPIVVSQRRPELAMTTHSIKLSDPWEEDDVDDDTLLDALSGQSPGMRRREQSHEETIAPIFNHTGADATLSYPETPHALLTYPDLDSWDDFLASNTQIAREITVEEKPTYKGHDQVVGDLLCTQDFDFSTDDLKELDVRQEQKPPDPSTKRYSSSHTKMGHFGGLRPSVSTEPVQLVAPERTIRGANSDDRLLMPPPPLKSAIAVTKQPATTTASRFYELGLCTQDVHQIIDDDIVLSDGD